jgi:hypothetical protein
MYAIKPQAADRSRAGFGLKISGAEKRRGFVGEAFRGVDARKRLYFVQKIGRRRRPKSFDQKQDARI